MNKIPIVITVAAVLTSLSAGWLLAQHQTKSTADASLASAAVAHTRPAVCEVAAGSGAHSEDVSAKEASDQSDTAEDRTAQAGSDSQPSADRQNPSTSSDQTTSSELAVNETPVSEETAPVGSDPQIQPTEIAQSAEYLPASLLEADADLSPRMKLIAIIDDKAMFSFSTGVAKTKRLPETLSLRLGEEFKSIKLLQTDSDAVVLEENGQRITKSMRSISAQRQQTALQDSTL
jgi:hypothetical protein